MPLVIYPLKRTNVAVLNDVTYVYPSIQSECETKLNNLHRMIWLGLAIDAGFQGV